MKGRKQTGEELRESEKRYRSLVDLSPDIIYRLNEDGKIRFISPAVQQLGYGPEELVGRLYEEIVHPDDREKVTNRFVERRVGERGMKDVEIRLLTKTGEARDYAVTYRVVSLSARGVWDVPDEQIKQPDKNFLYTQGVARDITKSKRVEKALRQQKEAFDRMLDSVQDAVWAATPDGSRFFYLSRATERIYGQPLQELRSDPTAWYKAVHPDDRAMVEKGSERLSRGEMVELEYRIVRPDGTVRWLSDRKRLVYDESSQPVEMGGIATDITERREIQQIATRFGRVLNGSPNEIFIFDAKTLHFVQVNDGAQRNLGYSMGELYGMTPLDIKPEIDRRQFDELILPLRTREAETVVLHTQHQRKDGTCYPCEIHISLTDQDDQAVFVAIVLDIHERLETEDQLRKLSRAIEASPASVVITDRGGIIEYVNPKFVEVTGYSVEEAIGQNPRILSTDKQSPEFYREMWDTLTAGNEWRGEFCNRKKNGEIYWESAAIAPVKNAQDQVTHYVAVKEDITEHRQAEEQLASMALFAEMNPGPVFQLDREGRLLLANHPARLLLGIPADEQDLLLATYPAWIQDAFLSATTRMQPVYHEHSFEGCHYLFTVRTIADTGEVNVYGADITDRKRFEDSLQAARKLAETATRAKSEFLANMSHEIRTPLNAVLGFLELVLEDSSLPERQQKHLTTAQISANNLLGLLNDILDISKLEGGKLTIENRPFSLFRLMQEIHETMDIKALEKGLELQLDISPSLSGSFLGDPMRLRQIMINLVGNAIKFTAKGCVTMRVMPAEEEGHLHFMIEDTGIGMTEEQLGKIYEPFTQADTSTTRRFGGTGLGTTISRELVELMGGRIWAESEEGKGSRFHFTITISPTDQVPEEADLFVVPGKAVLPGSRRGFRVLLAEDVEANVELAKIRLKQQGHEVTVAWNGREAVEAFEGGEIDVILMDVHMPEMSGIEATKRIRALEAGTGGHVPIIALTAGVMREEREKYLSVGMDAVVAKPIDFGKLFKTMENAIPEGVGEVVSEDTMDVRVPSGLELPLLDGVDTKKGIQTWQNAEAYAKALLGFSRDYGGAAADLSRLVDEGDIDSASSIAHALKGVAGNLSVTEVADAAICIDTALREKRIADVKGQLPTLAAALNTAVAAIRQLETGPDDVEMPKKEMDLAHLKNLFIKMLAAFDQFSPYAIEPFLSELKTYLSQDQLTPIVAHMERFDFDGAKQETVNLAKMLKIDLER